MQLFYWYNVENGQHLIFLTAIFYCFNKKKSDMYFVIYLVLCKCSNIFYKFQKDNYVTLAKSAVWQ